MVDLIQETRNVGCLGMMNLSLTFGTCILAKGYILSSLAGLPWQDPQGHEDRQQYVTQN
jgi:hypothetical protein